ncbi:MAG: heme-copper oxidase subunit III [Leptospiraceae bacterium]|nr:heme-copper oxidase subunit III [Leptospiraceae bacterium]
MHLVAEKRQPIVSSSALAMLYIITTELMFFTAIISAYIVNRASSRMVWPPVDQPRLPVQITGANTVVLIVSAICFTLGLRLLSKNKRKSHSANLFVIATVVLGATFIFIQGYEWAKLIGYGMVASKDLFAAFFYYIIGAHGLHAIAGLIAISVVSYQFYFSEFSEKYLNRLRMACVYWYFVVGIWPILYYLVYLY